MNSDSASPSSTVDEVRITATDPADLVAAVWFSLGYVPSESLLLTLLEGPRERLGLVMRADLPDPAIGSGPLRPLVRELFEGAHRCGATAVVAMVASERALGGPGRKARAILEREAQAAGIGLRDVLGVTPARYRSLRCSGPPCCPVGGRSVHTVMASDTAAAFIAQGAVVAPSAEALVADVRPDPARPEFPAGPVGDPVAGPVAAGPPPLPLPERLAWWSRWTEAFEATRAAEPGEPAAMSRPSLMGLSAALRDGHLRDTVVLHLLGAEPGHLAEMLEGRVPPPDPEELSEMDRLLGRPPRLAWLRAGEHVLAGCARAAPPGDRAPALAVLALLAWYRGHGVRARLLVEEGTRDLWAVTWPTWVTSGGPSGEGPDAGGGQADPADAGGAAPGGVSVLLDVVEGLLVWAGQPPWVSDGPAG